MFRALKLSTVSIYLLWFAAAFDPVGLLYGMRYGALVLVGCLLIFQFTKGQSKTKIVYPYSIPFIYFVIGLPLLGSIVGLIRGGISGNNFIDTSYYSSAILFACSLVYLTEDNLKTGHNALNLVLQTLSIAIILSWITTAAGLPQDWIYFFVENGVAYIGEREYGEVGVYYIYYIASPMLICLAGSTAWACIKKLTLWGILKFAVPCLALVASGTRTNILSAFIIIPVLLLWEKFTTKTAIGVVLVFGLAFYLAGMQVQTLKDMFSAMEGNNSIKLSYLEKYNEIFTDPFTLAIGQGLNAKEWSKSANELIEDGASKTELTYLELIRVFGIVGLAGFIIAIHPILSNTSQFPSQYVWIPPSLITYLLASATNPYIFSSNGMLLIGLFAASLNSKPTKEDIRGKSTIHTI